ncbi:hypothetical protein [Leptospira alexanderi]|uniref:hypothetical protein n=1 Tax=Leptospira alexanderi TaxID=100053 RepID=UPI001BAF4370|nr:hypothetical protein [Leptospira alexanderi]
MHEGSSFFNRNRKKKHSGYAIGKDGYLLSDFGNCLNLFLEYSIEKSDGCSLKGTLNFV